MRCPACDFDRVVCSNGFYFCGRCRSKWEDSDYVALPKPVRAELLVEKPKREWRKKLPQEIADSVLEQQRLGKQWKEIARIVGISKSAVGKIIMQSYRDQHIPRGRRGPKAGSFYG